MADSSLPSQGFFASRHAAAPWNVAIWSPFCRLHRRIPKVINRGFRYILTSIEPTCHTRQSDACLQSNYVYLQCIFAYLLYIGLFVFAYKIKAYVRARNSNNKNSTSHTPLDTT